jgi:hypothetical protein
VKRSSADDSVGPPHVKVGHRQVLIRNPCEALAGVFLYVLKKPPSVAAFATFLNSLCRYELLVIFSVNGFQYGLFAPPQLRVD